MAETTLEKATCENCGADVRKNTVFCYNCGRKFAEGATITNGSVPDLMSDETRNALDDLAARFKIDEAESENKLALAAAARKKARAPKKPKEVVWEVDDTRTGLLIFSLSLLIFAVVSVVVFITVYWK